ncbi:uncharacterized protein DUF1698 [Aliiruegeria haliotis]|uniref:Uncharacterized protein DUF1698 n=1 Tax=Aliiruegeria haliotis TaxID=1280846 RepID=A0A2T0RGH1_9RHOB|nr:methyltransferase domain-containing protein [Aliiruegeria haliotis]PRY20247.1 uncharacterized protein DUF1698 [Aliiruegeria haliotis]
MDSEQLKDWYYEIEVAPGVMSGGRVRGTLGMTREVIANMDLEGARCLDIGTQEAVAPVLMARQGASYVAAYDRLDLSDRLAIVQSSYGVDIDYYHSLEMHQLKQALNEREVPAFDVVIFAGVLYHMIDPLVGFAVARSTLRDGGIAVIESSVYVSDEFVMQFNAGGRYYQGSNYFQVSLACYEYFAHMVRLKPIDLLFTRPSASGISRVSMVCRAVTDVIADADDTWIRKGFVAQDMAAYGLRYRELASDKAPVPYTAINPELVFREGSDCIDVLKTFHASAPVVGSRRKGQLFLEDLK